MDAIMQRDAGNPDVIPLMRQRYEAEKEFRDGQKANSFREIFTVGRRTEKAREHAAQADANIVSFNLRQAEIKKAKEAAMHKQAVVGLHKMVLSETGDPAEATMIADMAYNDPELLKQLTEDYQARAQARIEQDADVTENIRGENAAEGFTQAAEDRSNVLFNDRLFMTQEEILDGLQSRYPNMDKKELGEYAGSGASFIDLTKMIDEKQKLGKERDDLEWNMNRAAANAIAEADNAVRQVNKTLKFSDEFGATGLLGSLLKNVPSTDAYNTWASIDTQNAKLAFEELLEMRRKSETGGALGNVSNREIELLYSAFTKLQPGMGKEAFQSNLTDVMQRFERLKFMLENEDAFREEGISVQEMNRRTNDYVTDQVAQAMGDPPEALEELRADPSPEALAEFEQEFGWRPISIPVEPDWDYEKGQPRRRR
jgi:hypothetical protein